MKVKNESISIKIGKKEQIFKNLILNDYIDLYAQSFVSFVDKILPFCLIKFDDDTVQIIDENSTTMDYDVVLETELGDIEQIFNENMVTNKYKYYREANESALISDYAGQRITGIGFANYDNTLGDYKIYAFLDVSSYNLTYQSNQSIIISRIDKITTDLKFYTENKEVNFPVHLTMKGILETVGMEYNTVYSQLYSIGTGTLYNKIKNEVLVEDLDFEKTGTGIVTIRSARDYSIYPSSDLYPSSTLYPGRTTIGTEELKIEDKGDGIYPSPLLYPSSTVYPKIATDTWVIYKFKLFRIRYEGETEIVEDTGYWYYQSEKTNLKGKLILTIKYERG